MPSWALGIILAVLAHWQPLIDYAGVEQAAALARATERARAEFGVTVDPRRLATLARYESHFRPETRGAAGERGILQIHPVHRKGMAKWGLDFDCADDRLVYGALLYAWHGDRPWSVRHKARKDYERWFR